MKRKQEQKIRNWFAVHAHNKTTAGVMGVKKGRKNSKKYDKLRRDLEEALEILNKIEDEE